MPLPLFQLNRKHERNDMPLDIDATDITRLHDRKLAQPDWPDAGPEEHAGLAEWIETNHRFNTLLWNEEDKARRTDVDAREIAACKRLIDRYNQQRNDAVEAIDELILAQLDIALPSPDARLNSETAGAMIDRLSILALKIHHMREQTQRVEVDASHVATCSAKLDRLVTQRRDLASCLDELLADAMAGRAWFKVYRQFKMYNDPTLNPYLYGSRNGTAAGEAAR
jgi:hypothetical protein